MLAERFTPRVIAFGLSAHLMLWLAAKLPEAFGLLAPHYHVDSFVRMPACVFAFIIATVLNLEIAREHRGTPWLRVAWLGLAANAFISIFRMFSDTSLHDFLWADYSAGPWRGFWRQATTLPANLGLLVGVMAMCWAYHRVGLGFKIKRRDWVLVLLSAALITGLLTMHEALIEAHSPLIASRYLQQAALVVLALVSAGSIVLHRMVMQMGGGKLAKSLRVLTIYVLARSTLALIDVLPFSPADHQVRIYLNSLGWQAVQWLPALAAAYRAQIAVESAREIALMERLGASSSWVTAAD